jgi:hypothetical protein
VGGSFSGFLNVLGYSIVLGLGGQHPIEKVGERWCGGRESSVGPHVEGAVGFSDPGLVEYIARETWFFCSEEYIFFTLRFFSALPVHHQVSLGVEHMCEL